MNIVICDVNKESVNCILNLLKKYMKKEEIKIITFLSGEEFKKAINKRLKMDIIFLGLDMEENSGIDIAKYIKNKMNNVIMFLIADNLKYASEAFRVGAFQLLVKPISVEVFDIDFKRAIIEYNKNYEFYNIKLRDKNVLVKYSDIFYIDSYNRHLYVHTSDKSYKSVGTMEPIQKKLQNYEFARCHRGYIVNMKKIKEISKSNIILVNGVEVPISRKYRDELINAFNIFVSGKVI